MSNDRGKVATQVRLLQLLDAVVQAGIAPIDIMPLHALAYLSNVLAPVWDLAALEGSVLKREGGPFYPELQQELDRLVGIGMVIVSDLRHVPSDSVQRVHAAYTVNSSLAGPILGYLTSMADTDRFTAFSRELAFAFSALSDDEIQQALVEDATYSDPRASVGSVLDFGEWKHDNPSVNAVRFFDAAARQRRWTAGEKLHLYVQHLHRRIGSHA